LEELGSYYLEIDLKQKDLKHALAGLLVEILLPLAAVRGIQNSVANNIYFKHFSKLKWKQIFRV
jgi:hypothetical protein